MLLINVIQHFFFRCQKQNKTITKQQLEVNFTFRVKTQGLDTHVHTHTHARARKYALTHAYKHALAHIHAHTHTLAQTHMCAHRCKNTCILLQTCAHTHTHSHNCTHTHIHTIAHTNIHMQAMLKCWCFLQNGSVHFQIHHTKRGRKGVVLKISTHAQINVCANMCVKPYLNPTTISPIISNKAES